ncbi:MAG: diguanylate cyclase [Burkholderiales bacterium]|nr:diguanylate cyclase [Burkholderiales bacterium]
MDPLAAGFWGAFFGTVGLMFAASLIAFARSLQRVALTSALSAVVSALFVVAYLGWFPLDRAAAQPRLLTHIAMGAAVTLALMLLSLLGELRQPAARQRAMTILLGTGGAVLVASWLLDPWQSLLLGSAAAIAIGVAMLVAAVRSAMRGDRLAWASVSGVFFMLCAVAGLTWIALDDSVHWLVHAGAALSGIWYLAAMAAALWSRYSYLLELSEVMAHGPAYDPVTRMRSHSETGHLVGLTFRRRDLGNRTVGVIVVSVANLYSLEKLHGRAASNHALFVCASRLRRSAPAHVEMGRLSEDGFLLLLGDVRDFAGLVQLARQLRDRLARPVELGTSSESLDGHRTSWVADVGIGVLATTTQARPSQAVGAARAMSRSAWANPERLVARDERVAAAAPAPVADPAA